MDEIKEKKVEDVSPQLRWEFGTAYDLMMSLEVLHNPENFGLRASWAAGVRSRLDSFLAGTERQRHGLMGAAAGIPQPASHKPVYVRG
jgi:hypothetical protein